MSVRTFGERTLPTKINLIKLRRELAMLKRVRKVLEEKRDVVLLYIRQAAKEYERAYRKAAETLEEIYREYFTSLSLIGVEALKPVVEAVPETLTIDVRTRVLFAIKTPMLTLVEETLPPAPASLLRMSPEIVEVKSKLIEAFKALLELAETEAAIVRLLKELRETQRLINALDYNILPSYEQAIKYIKLVLEDRAREDIMRLKGLKRRFEARRATGR